MAALDRLMDHRRLARGMAVAVLLLGALAGSLVVAASGAFAQTTTDGPERVYALTISDRLLFFDGDRPSKTTGTPITGLGSGESLVGIDFRPADSRLYGVSNAGKVYLIDETTGVATFVSTLSVPLEGDRFGVDFDPVADRLRILSDADQNLRANVDTGETVEDTDLQYAAGDPNAGRNPIVTAAAYRNNQPGATTTELYDIDAGIKVPSANALVEQNPPDDGTLNTVGPLGRSVKMLTGFDIVTVGASPAGDRAFAALQAKGNRDTSYFYSVDLDTGKTTGIGRIGGMGTNVEGLAIPIGQQ